VELIKNLINKMNQEKARRLSRGISRICFIFLFSLPLALVGYTQAFVETSEVFAQEISRSNKAMPWIPLLLLGDTHNPPNPSCCPHPGDGEGSVSVYTFLSWGRSDTILGSLTYDVYLGTSADPPLVKNNHETLFYFPDPLKDNTTYYWKIVVRDKEGLTTEGPLWQFHTLAEPGNSPPDDPSDPQPEDGAVNIATSSLSWTCSDPDGDDIKYHLYWGLTKALTNYAHDIDTTTYTLPYLTCWYRHYWKIIAEDEHGAAKEGPLWYFDAAICSGNRPPCEPYNPSPPDGATGVDTEDVLLSWEFCDPDGDSLTYAVRWGKTPMMSNGVTDLAYNTFVLYDLEPGTHYYWWVVAKDEHDAETPGPVWTFWTVEPPEVPIVNTIITNYHGESIDSIYASARSESWNKYVNDNGIDTTEEGGFSIGQIASAGPWVIQEPLHWGWRAWNQGWYTRGEYTLHSKAGYSTANLIIHLTYGFWPTEPNWIYDTFIIEFYIDGVKVGEHPYQTVPNKLVDEDLTISLPFDSMKTGSKIPVEFRSNRVKKDNPIPLFEPGIGELHYCFEFAEGFNARIVLE
jgi:hypothetical protein